MFEEWSGFKINGGDADNFNPNLKSTKSNSLKRETTTFV